MEDKLIEKAAQSQDKIYRKRPGITETNRAYFGILLFCAFTVLFLPLLNGMANKTIYIALSVASLILSIPLFILGVKLSKKKNIFKCFYYFDFLFIALSIMFSVLAVTAHYEITLKIGSAFLVAGCLVLLAALDLFVLSIGKRERLLFSLMILLFLAAIIAGEVVLFKNENTAVGLPLFAYSLVFLFLHLTMLIYVCGGDGFFELMSFSYLVIGVVVLIIVLIVISGSGDCTCDCGGADCGGGGGRRKNKAGNLSAMQGGINRQ